MNLPISATGWLEAASASLAQVGEAMGLATETIGDVSERCEQVAGSYISLVSPTNALQVGVLMSKQGCRKLAAHLLGISDHEAAALPDSDVADGVGELVNMLVGLMKTMVQSQDTDLRLGLPMFLFGEVQTGKRASQCGLDCRIGGIPCSVIVVMHEAKPAAMVAAS